MQSMKLVHLFLSVLQFSHAWIALICESLKKTAVLGCFGAFSEMLRMEPKDFLMLSQNTLNHE